MLAGSAVGIFTVDPISRSFPHFADAKPGPHGV
jgi:hypothetical protein